LKGNATTAPAGLSVGQILHFYGFDQIKNWGAGQTIGIVDAFDDPNIESDLAVFNSQFGLPPCNSANGCFKKIYASGRKPRTDSEWSLEISLDVQWSHAIAPQAKIILVEAATNRFTDIMNAVDVAVQNGVNVVSMSFGGAEFSAETNYDHHFQVASVTFTASSGDSGSGVEYPAASPYVVAVEGTTIQTNASGDYLGETGWSGSGGGQSTFEGEPVYQSGFSIPNANEKRGVPDVAYDADPNTAFSIYDTVGHHGQVGGWLQVGGTSAGAPQWAALFAVVNSIRVAGNKSTIGSAGLALYNETGYGRNFHDITSGSNGTCGALCLAGPGYDYITGLGSPQANNLVPYLNTH